MFGSNRGVFMDKVAESNVSDIFLLLYDYYGTHLQIYRKAAREPGSLAIPTVFLSRELHSVMDFVAAASEVS